MHAEELTFQYWQDGLGAWQWQLIAHERPTARPETQQSPAVLNHRIIASGGPLPNEAALLADIDRVRSSASARTVRQSPSDPTTPGEF
ncbi:MAG: hypothetical protein SFU53_02010 [Terrimicrobiaceae bacterium]|nr:hypothetical protein [Terrimicrobiaceae bacterium]